MSMSNSNSNTPNQPDKPISPEPVRSRWTPKPEQILILESIFNSGMVNPPKDETVRIRKLLENFGAVGDANVFYWFQNRRSRSRRRQRLMQAAEQPRQGGGEPSTSNSSGGSGGFASVPVCAGAGAGTGTAGYGGGGVDDGGDDLFAISRQMGFPELHYQSGMAAGLITVFINGIATEVPEGRIDMRAMFGNDVLLVHSSGEVVPTTDHGILLHGLQMGENYFLVSKSVS